MSHDNLSAVDLQLLRVNRQWQSQYRLLMQWGDLIQPKPQLRTTENKIRGCAVNAWLELHNDRFSFDSESRIINGLAALILAQVEKGQESVDNNWAELLRELGLSKHLSPSRNNGILAMTQRMRELWQLACTQSKNPLPRRGEG